MHDKRYIVIANWKMNFSFNQTVLWLKNNHESLMQLPQNNISLVICPSFESLWITKTNLKESLVLLGAQDCSEHETGPFTAQVSAQSLKELGCRYCLIGHSETFENWDTYQETLHNKITMALTHDLTPIMCFGESKEEHEQKMTEASITKQITHYCSALKKNSITKGLFAYEPKWAIGSGKIPDTTHIEKILILSKKIADSFALDATMMYGGSVSSKTVLSLKKISVIEGFLLGKASTDFQELKKVVSLLQE